MSDPAAAASLPVDLKTISVSRPGSSRTPLSGRIAELPLLGVAVEERAGAVLTGAPPLTRPADLEIAHGRALEEIELEVVALGRSRPGRRARPAFPASAPSVVRTG